MPAFSVLTNPTSPAQAEIDSLANFWRSLERGRFFKVILGASFTNVEKIEAFARAYTLAGVDCIDIAADWGVLNAVETALSDCAGNRPVVMVSLPLDPDPHFRKIDLNEPDCIRCSLCLPVCPAGALTLPDSLEISQTLCYGCGRCVPVCPTNALSLLPFQVEEQVEAVLANPLVQAVEIHSHHIDPEMLREFFQRWGKGLQGKIISLCFRPENFPQEKIMAFCKTFQTVAGKLGGCQILLQIDGAPMSGNEDPNASLPALEAARLTHRLLMADQDLRGIPITISGGINRNTAVLRQQPEYRFIRGVGMGTVARQAIDNRTEEEAVLAAKAMLTPFTATLQSP